MTDSPRQLDHREWLRRFADIPDELVQTTRYYRHLPDAEWSQYLFPPSSHLPYGNRLLRKLRFDDSLAALRLWGFILSEGERLYRARQSGMKLVALMGDLGALTPLVASFPGLVPFYPDCLWWTPFLAESRVLFDAAAELGMGDDCCYVRAALGGWAKLAYFPQPDLTIGTVGATCDDMAAVMAGVERLNQPLHYFELPLRADSGADAPQRRERAAAFLTGQYRDLCAELEALAGVRFDPGRFRETAARVNQLRQATAELKRLVAAAPRNPMGALEMLNAEFAALSYYGDLDECLAVLEQLRDTVRERVESGAGYPEQQVKLLWVTPPADPLLMNYIEELGGRVAASEYLINQTTPLLDPDADPFEALARAHLAGSLMGSTRFRADLVLKEAAAAQVEGAVISGVFGSTHCPWETAPLVEALRAGGIPTLAFDVVAPGRKRLQSQLWSRMEAFMEMLQARRGEGPFSPRHSRAEPAPSEGGGGNPVLALGGPDCSQSGFHSHAEGEKLK